MTPSPEPSAAPARRSAISAPPGLGKSRLCFEFARVARDRLVPVLELRASPYDHSGPLQPLVEFFRTFFRLASTDDPETARSKIASRIEATVPELIDDVSILADFLGIRDATSPALMLDPKTRHARLINLVSSLVRDGTRTPSVIIIEDIHWLDEASVEFVSALVDIISRQPRLAHPHLSADLSGAVERWRRISRNPAR